MDQCGGCAPAFSISIPTTFPNSSTNITYAATAAEDLLSAAEASLVVLRLERYIADVCLLFFSICAVYAQFVHNSAVMSLHGWSRGSQLLCCRD